MESIRESAIRWVASARGLREDAPADDDAPLAEFLARFGYEVDDVKRMDWLAAAVLVERGGGLRDYVERFGDLAGELRAAAAEAQAAMNGDPPTDASLRHDLRSREYRARAM